MIEVEKSFREKTLRAMGILRLHLSLQSCVFPFFSSLPRRKTSVSTRPAESFPRGEGQDPLNFQFTRDYANEQSPVILSRFNDPTRPLFTIAYHSKGKWSANGRDRKERERDSRVRIDT